MTLDEHTIREFSNVLEASPSTRVEDFTTDRDVTEAVNLRKLLVVEMVSRLRLGEELREAEFKSRFPDLASDIPELLEIAENDAEESAFDTTSRIGWATDKTATIQATGTPTSEPARTFPQSTLGEYELLEVIGRGGMGIVYRARQPRLNRIVALKTIVTGQHASAAEAERFRREAEAAARLDHIGIVPVFDTGEHDGLLYFSMGFVDGVNLADHLRDNTLTAKQAADLARQLAVAVQYAHDSDVVHRDLKPGNILLDENGQAKIVDFGLARMTDREGLTRTGAAMGTPSYMAPEQASGTDTAGPKSDVYGLGAILYATLSGVPPFRGASALATIKMVIHDRATPLRQLRPDIPKDLETICDKCLEKLPNARYESAGALAEELTRFLEGRPILARPVPFWVRAARWCQRNASVAVLMAMVFLTLVTGVAVSSYFAWLASRRATTAETASAAATTNAKMAKEQSQLALKSLQTIIRSVQERLKNIPAAREVRRELLTKAIRDLEEVSGAYVQRQTVDRETAKALTDLAALYTEIGDETDASVEDLSDKHFRHAVDIYLQLIDQSPDDVSLIDEAFTALIDYGDTMREYRRFQKAVWAHGEGRKLAIRWHAKHSESAPAKLAYLRSAEALGEALLRSGKGKESREYILESVDLAKQYCETHQDIDAFKNLARCHCTEGDMYRAMRAFEQADAAYQQMCNATLRSMELAPDDPNLLNDRSTDFERLGDLEMARKDFAKAREYYEECVRLSQAYVADDPTNLYRLQETTWGYSKLANCCKAQGDVEREKWARATLAEVQKKIRGR